MKKWNGRPFYVIARSVATKQSDNKGKSEIASPDKSGSQ
jgi:hypothetical protein